VEHTVKTRRPENWQKAFDPHVLDWFQGQYPGPTPVQKAAWPAIASGKDALLAAPTGRHLDRGHHPDRTESHPSPTTGYSGDHPRIALQPVDFRQRPQDSRQRHTRYHR